MISSQQGISGAWRLTGTRKLLAVVETFLWLLVLFWQIASLHCIGRVTSFTAQSFLHTAHTVYVYCRYLQYSASDIILTDIWPPYLHPPQQITNLWHKSWVHSAGRSVMGVSILSLTGQSDGAKTGPTITRTYLSKQLTHCLWIETSTGWISFCAVCSSMQYIQGWEEAWAHWIMSGGSLNKFWTNYSRRVWRKDKLEPWCGCQFQNTHIPTCLSNARH